MLLLTLLANLESCLRGRKALRGGIGIVPRSDLRLVGTDGFLIGRLGTAIITLLLQRNRGLLIRIAVRR